MADLGGDQDGAVADLDSDMDGEVENRESELYSKVRDRGRRLHGEDEHGDGALRFERKCAEFWTGDGGKSRHKEGDWIYAWTCSKLCAGVQGGKV